MFRSRLGGVILALVMAVFVLAPARVGADRKKPPAAPPPPTGGVVWEVKIFNDKGDQVEDGKFRAVNFRIYHKNKQIGTYKDLAKDHSTVDIKHSPRLNGKFDIKMVKTEPPTWEGEVKKDGVKYKVVVLFVKPK